MEVLPPPFVDRLHIEPGEHEVAVERGDWLFYIRVARRGELIHGYVGAGDIFYDLILMALMVVFAYPITWWFERQPQKVVVVRFDSRKSWGGGRRQFRGWLYRDEDPAPLVEELLTRTLNGDFDRET